MTHVLVVDDDEDILSLLAEFVRKHGHIVTVAQDSGAMYAALESQDIDIVILDVMLRDEDGFEICRQLRAKRPIPIIMLTAVADPTDRVVGLEVGADDYLIKPFDTRELLARVKAVLRRVNEPNNTANTKGTRPVLSFLNWRLDIAKRELRSNDNALLILSGGEFDLLLAFVEHPQQVLKRERLLDFLHGNYPAGYDRSIDVQVSRLRHKLEDDPKTPAFVPSGTRAISSRRQ